MELDIADTLKSLVNRRESFMQLLHEPVSNGRQKWKYLGVVYFVDLRVGRELSFFKKLRSNPVFIASIKVFQQLISFKWFQIIK